MTRLAVEREVTSRGRVEGPRSLPSTTPSGAANAFTAIRADEVRF